jgi:IS605 OrfB family transposase
MRTLNLPVLSCSNTQYIDDKSTIYSHAFRFMFKTFEECGTKQYETKFKTRFNLNDIEYRSLKSNCESFIKKQNTQKDNTTKRIEDKTDELNELLNKKLNGNITKKENYSIHKLRKLIQYLTKSLKHNTVFGGRKNLKHLTHLHNQYNNKLSELNGLYNEIDIINCEQELILLFDNINKQKGLYTKQRIWDYYLIGEANYYGNRFFDFSKLVNGKLIYKPNRHTKIEFNLKINNNRLKTIKKLITLSNEKNIALSVYVSNDVINISYDDAKLNGWNIDEKSRRKDVNEIKSKKYNKDYESELIKQVYKKYHDDLRDKMLVGKIKDRALAIDMNPSYIGVSILERDIKNEDIDNNIHAIKIIKTFCYDITKFTKKLPKEASKEERLYIKNKHKHELKEIIIHLFNILNHYKCSKFIMEDLDFKEPKQKNKKNKESNRQTKNIWNRNLIEDIILKYCTQYGVELIKVNPSYSSIIGNLTYNYFDPINSSIEIGRRGLYRFIKNLTGYPLIGKEILDTVDFILEENKADVRRINVAKARWSDLYNLIKQYRWRGSLKVDNRGNTRSMSKRSMSTIKSGIKILF